MRIQGLRKLIAVAVCCGAAQMIVMAQVAAPRSGAGLPVFPYTNGWLGADAAYSVSLGQGRSVWLFGDTFAGKAKTHARKEATAMVRNSVGIGACAPKKACTMSYYWGKQHTAKPTSFFNTGRDDIWYWPLDGYFNGKSLYLALAEVRTRPGALKTDALGFEITGTLWAKVSNPLERPTAWKVETQEFTRGSAMLGATMVRDGEFLLLYADVDQGQGNGYMAAVRVPLGKLDAPAAHSEYLGQDRQWHAGLPQSDALHVIDQSISEMSVRYHATLKKWVAVSFGPGFMTNYMVTRTADSAVGPWSEPRKFYTVPEMIPARPGYDRETFCYAAKEHTEFEAAPLVVTYVCNSLSFGKTSENMSIYRPQVITAPLPR